MYFYFALIDRLSFTPEASPEDSDNSIAIREADRRDTPVHAAKTVVPLLPGTVVQVFGNDAA